MRRLGIYGLFAANLFAYGFYHDVFRKNIPYFDMWMYMAFLGRGLTAILELYMCCSYLSFVLEQDRATRAQSKAK